MSIRNRIISAAAALAAALTAAGCANTTAATDKTTAKSDTSAADNSGKLNIVCTIFPEYDWVREILGDKADNVEITYLLDNGVDLHSYQPTAEDIIKISGCDLFIYVGGESDEWTDDVLSQAENKDMKVINLMETVGSRAKEEELKEGMQGEEEEEHDHEEGEDHDGEDEEHEHEHEHEEGEVEYDEHVWLSLQNAEIICAEIEKDLSEIDPENSDTYKTNLEAYTEKLITLDGQFKELADSAENKTLIFGDRFPFRYFVEDYGIDYYAAFIGCSAETEASFETITFLAQKADELGTDTIYTIEGSDGKIADAIAKATSAKSMNIAVLNSVQAVSAEDIANGVSYLSLMQQNYDTLKADIG